MTIKNPNVKILFAILLCLFVLAFLRFDLYEILRISFLFFVLTFVGGKLIEFSWQRRIIFAEKISAGLMCGFAILLFVDFLLSVFNVDHWISYAIVTASALTVIVLGKVKSHSDFGVNNHFDVGDAILILSIAVSVFNFRAFWTLPLAAFLLLCRSHPTLNSSRESSPRTKRIRNASLVGSVVLLVAAIALNRKIPWSFSFSNDASFYESLQWSLIRYGPHEHPGFLGGFTEGSLVPYHTTAYSLGGLVSKFAGLEPFEFMNSLGPFILSVMAVGMVFTYSKTTSFNLAAKIFFCFVVSGTLIQIGNYNSQSFGLVLLAVLISTAISTAKLFENEVKGQYFIPILALSIFAITIKGTNALVVSAVLFALLLNRLLSIAKGSEKLKAFVYICVVVAVVTVTTWWKFIRIPSHVFTLSRSGPRLIDLIVVGGIQKAAVEMRLQLFTLALISALLLICFLRQPGSGQKRETINWQILAGLNCAFFAFVILQPQEPVSARFICESVVNLAIVFTLISEFRFRGISRDEKSLGFVVTFALLLGSTFGLIYRLLLIPNMSSLFNALSNIPKFGQWFWYLLIENPFITHTIFIALVLHATLLVLHQRVKSRLISSILITALIGSAVSLKVDNYAEYISQVGSSSIVNEFFSPGSINAAANATVDLNSVAEFARSMSTVHDVFASNNFCCFGDTWWKETLSNPVFGTVSSMGGANYLLPAITQRRFLIQGMRFQIFYGLPSFSEHIQRMNISLRFANDPDQPTKQALVDYGVKYFIVNKQLTLVTDWSVYAKTIYENKSFALLAL